MKTTKKPVLYEVPKFRVRCISGHKCDIGAESVKKLLSEISQSLRQTDKADP